MMLFQGYRYGFWCGGKEKRIRLKALKFQAKPQGNMGPKGIKKSLKSKINASFFRHFHEK